MYKEYHIIIFKGILCVISCVKHNLCMKDGKIVNEEFIQEEEEHQRGK